jgi:hypothetical protein
VIIGTSLVTHRGQIVGESTFTFRVDEELKAAFAEVTASQERTAAQLLRALMKDVVHRAVSSGSTTAGSAARSSVRSAKPMTPRHHV